MAGAVALIGQVVRARDDATMCRNAISRQTNARVVVIDAGDGMVRARGGE